MYKPVWLDARDRAVRLGAQGKAEQLGGAGEAAELCGAAEILGVPLTKIFSYLSRSSFMRHLVSVPN